MPESTPIRPSLVSSMKMVSQQTKVVAAETVTDTRWEQGLGQDQFVATGQKTQVVNFDTVTKARWEGDAPWNGPAVLPGKPRPQGQPPGLPAIEPKPAVTPISGGAQPATRAYRVKDGDFMVKIAREQLGDARRWKEIVALNKDRYPSLVAHPERIQPGWTLRLPAKPPAVPVGPVVVGPTPIICKPPVPVPPPLPPAPVEPVVVGPTPIICKPPVPVPVPPPVVEPPAPVVEPTKPTADAKVERLRKDLDLYLAGPENRDSGAILHVLRTAPQYAEAATAEQKARMIQQVLKGGANGDERRGALKLLELADAKGELAGTVRELAAKKALEDALHDLGDHGEGVAAAKLLLEAGLYAEDQVWKAMDDDATSGLVKALGFREPMIGTSDALRALPEAAKHHMIKELLAGNLTWGELAQAEWINQHTAIAYRIPDYRNQ